MIESLFLPLIAALSLAGAQPAEDNAPTASTQDEDQSAALAKLSAEDRAALRCSAAFAIVTNRAGGGGVIQQELRERGREFFVVTLANLMDKHSLDRGTIEREVRTEARELSEPGKADEIMPACLLMLQSAGL